MNWKRILAFTACVGLIASPALSGTIGNGMSPGGGSDDSSSPGTEIPSHSASPSISPGPQTDQEDSTDTSTSVDSQDPTTGDTETSN